MIAGTARGQELEPKRVIDCKIASWNVEAVRWFNRPDQM